MNAEFSKCRHVVWDWNGTLLDDAWLCVEILNEALRRRGRAPVSPEQYAEQFNLPVEGYYRRLGFNLKEGAFERMAAEFFEQYNRRRPECRLRPGAERVLRACHAAGLGQSILSAYEQGELNKAVAARGLRSLFTEVVGLDDHRAGSKAEAGLRLLERLACRPEEVLLVGDVGHDFQVAAAMGAKCALIPGGHHPRHKLERWGVPVLTELEELLPLVLGP
jgi:phosphoglycolate phosphatase